MQVPSHTDESAFTLFELLVVCALISLMLAVAAPTLRNTLLTDPLRTSARQLIGLVRGTRESAIRERQAYSIYCDLTENRVWAEKDTADALPYDPEHPQENSLQLSESVRFLDLWTAARGKLDEGVQVLWVSKQGYMDQTMIHLGSKDDEVISLLFSPFLSSVRISDSYVDLD